VSEDFVPKGWDRIPSLGGFGADGKLLGYVVIPLHSFRNVILKLKKIKILIWSVVIFFPQWLFSTCRILII